jgi:hypothetical protein
MPDEVGYSRKAGIKKLVYGNYNLIINVLAINNLNMLGNIIVDIMYNNIAKTNIPKVNKLRK